MVRESSLVEKQDLLSKGEISILLDTYDDIFSDFDPRPYSQRALSDDFLIEAKKAARDKEGTFELRFLAPKEHRNFEHEMLIKKRLRDHFKKHVLLLEKEIKSVKKKGILMAIAGVAMIIIATFLLSAKSDSFLTHFLIVILEPAGWFTAWTGLDEIYYTTRSKKPDYDFYFKMTNSEIHFISY
ncbi:MAG: hypothetical protein AABW75_00190 [Nanoarchaeota archaeon]